MDAPAPFAPPHPQPSGPSPVAARGRPTGQAAHLPDCLPPTPRSGGGGCPDAHRSSSSPFPARPRAASCHPPLEVAAGLGVLSAQQMAACPLKVSKCGGSCQGRPRPRRRRAWRRDRTLRGLLWRLFCTIGLWPRRQAEQLTTHKDADKRKVDAGLVTLKRSVALVPACHSRVPVASGSYLLL